MITAHTKYCYSCKKYKKVDEFGSNAQTVDGKQAYCKECRRIKAKKWRDANKAKCNSWSRRYYKNNKKKCNAACKQYRESHREELSIYNNERYAKNPETFKLNAKKWSDANWDKRYSYIVYRRKKESIKYKANNAVCVAVRSGKLIRPSKCSSCKCRVKTIHAHHIDYSKPLDVTWLCYKCHMAVHRKYNKLLLSSNVLGAL